MTCLIRPVRHGAVGRCRTPIGGVKSSLSQCHTTSRNPLSQGTSRCRLFALYYSREYRAAASPACHTTFIVRVFPDRSTPSFPREGRCRKSQQDLQTATFQLQSCLIPEGLWLLRDFLVGIEPTAFALIPAFRSLTMRERWSTTELQKIWSGMRELNPPI